LAGLKANAPEKAQEKKKNVKLLEERMQKQKTFGYPKQSFGSKEGDRERDRQKKNGNRERLAQTRSKMGLGAVNKKGQALWKRCRR